MSLSCASRREGHVYLHERNVHRAQGWSSCDTQEEKKAKDTQRWLACIEPHLPLLEQLSLWLRYVTLTNDRHASNGCICVSLQRAKGVAAWRVQDEWKWITVTKKPSVAGRDATFLRSELRRLIADDPDCIANAQTFSTTVAELKMFYAKEKMS